MPERESAVSQRMLVVGAAIVVLSIGAAFFVSQRTPVTPIPAIGATDTSHEATDPAPPVGIGKGPLSDAKTAEAAQPSEGSTPVGRTPAESAGIPETASHEVTPVNQQAAPKPILKDWKVPAAAFVLSGEMHGYVEPCGCSLNQLGGLSRRADLFRQIKERGWPVTGLDTGGLVSNPSRRQAKVKMRMALDALHELQYAGIAMGVEEIQMGIDLLQFPDTERPPFLSCNLVLGGADIGTHVTKTIATVGGVKIGVTSVFGDSLTPKVVSQNAGQGGLALEVEVLGVEKSLKAVLAELQAEKPDLLVLLSHAKLAESKTLAEQFPEFHLLVSAGGPEDPDPNPQYVGGTLVVAPGQKGKHVAVVGYYPDEPDRKLRYEAIALDGDRFHETESMREHMRKYQQALEVQELVSGEPRIEDPRNIHLTEANPFVGSKACGECHTKAYKKWLETGHAKATQSIKTGREGEEAKYISRIHDPECVACHTTGWDTGRDDPKDYHAYKSGYVSELLTPHLTGQGCENCHGPGGRHTDLERQFQKDKQETDELQKFRDFVHVDLDGAGLKLCIRCHDAANDPDFKAEGEGFEIHWKQIKHPWRN